MFTIDPTELTVYNAKVIKDEQFTGLSFVDDAGTYFMYVYDEREGRTLKSFANQLTRSGSVLYLNASVADMTFDDLGKYYYEIGYDRSGGYEEILKYGTLVVI